MLPIVIPPTLVVGAIRPAVCSKALLLVFNVLSLVPAAFRENKRSKAMLCIIYELALVSIATCKLNCAVAMHLVATPIANVGAPFWEDCTSMPMTLAIVDVALVIQLGHSSIQIDRRQQRRQSGHHH